MSRKNRKRKNRRLSPRHRSPQEGKTPLSKAPFDIDSELRKAIQHHQSGRLQKAEELYRKILEIDPHHSDSLHLLGLIAHEAGKNDIAISCFRKALQLKPDYAEACYGLANALKEQGKLNEAISFFRKTVQLKPDYVEAYNNMGIALRGQGKCNEAIDCYKKALDIKPNHTKAYYNMGNAFQQQGKLNEAISCYGRALQLAPDFVDAHNNMGNAFLEQGRQDEAISCFQKTLQLKPDYAKTHYNLGNAFQEQDRLSEAISCFQKALRSKVDFPEAYSALVHQLQRICAWQALKGLSAKLDILTKQSLDKGMRTAESPFFSVTRQADLSRNFAIAKSWSRDIARRISDLKIDFSFDGRRSYKKKIAVGYLSNDFWNHATAHLMLSLFGLHNRDEFEVFCYSYGRDDGSYYRARIERDCDKFVDLQNLNHVDAGTRIYDDQVDILVDLKGHTKGSRLAISALRPAPIQVSYLGFPGTTGADFFDYIITDRVVTPKDHAAYYSENFVYLPHCYQVNDNTQMISHNNWTKGDFGLTESCFIFCSFNQGYKIDPVLFDRCMRILRQVPETVLWLLGEDGIAEKNLKLEAEARDVEAERLVFGGKLPKDEHLERVGLADLALDTRIVNGHTTTSDALWAGVPVVTLKGSHFASRVSASILTAIGLPELITHSLKAYETLAVRLARNPDELQRIQQRLEKNRLTKPLFDTPRFVRNMEEAYKEMWEIFLAGERPHQIDVVENYFRCEPRPRARDGPPTLPKLPS